ncbi:hypothetical protein BURPS406E_D0210 [Burkholderia pseudomallei 406e]|nr:hypothetical protein BURPS406E_D0210 [Burkholderia pseudomallei 406e]EDS83479.1 hypothetical protein BURPSS13_X0930 [Burkholderia pseudomallei S13]
MRLPLLRIETRTSARGMATPMRLSCAPPISMNAGMIRTTL